MKRYMMAFVMTVYGCTIIAMEIEQPSSMVSLRGRSSTMSIPQELFPDYTSFGFGRVVQTQLSDSFMTLFFDLLSLNRMGACIGRIGTKCYKDVDSFFKKLKIDQPYDFVSWFELVYLIDMANLPSIMKDHVLVQLATLIHGHEQEAAHATASIENVSVQATLQGAWKVIAGLYHKLFDQELAIEGISAEDYVYSVQQIVLLDKDFIDRIQPKGIVAVDLSNKRINSVEGIDYLLYMLNKKYPIKKHRYAISLLNNMISSLPDDFLASAAPGLNILNLSNNMLKVLPQNFLSTAPELTHLSLYHNQLGLLPLKFLLNAPNVQQLDLSFNQLRTVPRTNFLDKAPHLTHLSLSNNKFTFLPGAFLSNCRSLIHVNLMSNNLKELPANFLLNSPLLKDLYLSGNRFLDLPQFFLYGCPLLEKFTLRNKDQTYPDGLQELPEDARRALEKTEKEMIEKQELQRAEKRKREEEQEEMEEPGEEKRFKQ